MASVSSALPINPLPVSYLALSALPENIYNQFQDTRTGEYAFGYAGGLVAREEAKTAEGVTRGAYSYVDTHGIVHHYRYVADEDGFRVAGTNIPTDETSARQMVQLAEIVPETLIETTNRRKRSAPIFHEIPASRVQILHALLLATTSQSHVQIHKSPNTEIHTVQPFVVETVATISAAPVAVVTVPIAIKTIGTIPVAISDIAVSDVPVSTSSQSRFQIHKSLKTEINVPVVEAVESVPIAPVIAKVSVAAPVAVASTPVATSSQSRFQVHNSLKTVVHELVDAIPGTPLTAEVPIAVPLVVASTAVATSSQSRFQVHNSLKTVVHKPVDVIPVAPLIAEVPIAAPLEVASIPVATSRQNRFQVHTSLKTEIHEPVHAIPVAPLGDEVPVVAKTIAAVPAAASYAAAAASISTSAQSRFQIHDSLKTKIHEPVHAVSVVGQILVSTKPLIHSIPVGVKTIETIPTGEPTAAHTPAGFSASIGLAPRHPVNVGAGLGVVSSPFGAYYTYDSPLIAAA